MKKQSSGTDLQRIDAMSDADIDTSEIPELGEDFFRKATIWKRERKISITLRVDKEVVEWFKSQGKGYQSLMNAVLKAYAEDQASRGEHDDSRFDCLREKGLTSLAHAKRDNILARHSVWPMAADAA